MRDELFPPSGHPPSWRDRLLVHVRRKKWRGFVRLYALLKPLTGQRQLRTVTCFGSQFFLTPWDSVDTHVLTEGFYESEVLEAVRPFIGAKRVLWVIGANFGLHAITAKVLYPETQVVAFEPSPSMGARILANCELNAVTVDLHAYALSDKPGALPFFANASGNPGMSTLHPVNEATYDHRFTVATLTASQVIEQKLAPAPHAIILDAEGAETEVLRGFDSHLTNPELRAIVLEAPNDFLDTGDPADLRQLITTGGFHLSSLRRQENTGHSLSNFLGVRA